MCKIFSKKKNVVSSLIYMILLIRLPVAGYCDWTFEVGRQSRVGALEVLKFLHNANLFDCLMWDVQDVG